MLETTLCLLKKDNEILLAMKKRGFGEGKYNGVGGKIENGETPEEAMLRETQEEIAVTPTKYEKVGFLEFDEYYARQYREKPQIIYVAKEMMEAVYNGQMEFDIPPENELNWEENSLWRDASAAASIVFKRIKFYILSASFFNHLSKFIY